MRIKHTVLIFLIGLLSGVGVSPFANSRPQRALKAPIPVTLAHMPRAVVPMQDWDSGDTKQVLGASDIGKETKDTSEVEDERKSFVDFLTEDEEEERSERTVLAGSKDSPSQDFQEKTVTIAIFGDSMVDTMATGLPYLQTALSNYYPNIDFVLLNYGVGAQNVEAGLARVNQSHSYNDRHYQPLTNPGAANIVIIGSFSYNPFSDKDINYHWVKLAELVNAVKNSGKKVLLLAENAPAKAEFGSGPNGINWPQDTSWQHGQKISQYLESATKLAPSIGVGLIDCYHPSLLSNGEGSQTYINQTDHIHPSVAGHQFIAQKIAERIYQLNMVQ